MAAASSSSSARWKLEGARADDGADGPRDLAPPEATAGRRQAQAAGGTSMSSAQPAADRRPEMRPYKGKRHAALRGGDEGARRGRQVPGFEPR